MHWILSRFLLPRGWIFARTHSVCVRTSDANRAEARSRRRKKCNNKCHYNNEYRTRTKLTAREIDGIEFAALGCIQFYDTDYGHLFCICWLEMTFDALFATNMFPCSFAQFIRFVFLPSSALPVGSQIQRIPQMRRRCRRAMPLYGAVEVYRRVVDDNRSIAGRSTEDTEFLCTASLSVVQRALQLDTRSLTSHNALSKTTHGNLIQIQRESIFEWGNLRKSRILCGWESDEAMQ